MADEPGTLQFDLVLPNDDDKKLLLYERYVDEDAFQVHREGESIKVVNAAIREQGIKMKLSATRCSVVD